MVGRGWAKRGGGGWGTVYGKTGFGDQKGFRVLPHTPRSGGPPADPKKGLYSTEQTRGQGNDTGSFSKTAPSRCLNAKDQKQKRGCQDPGERKKAIYLNVITALPSSQGKK